MLKNTGLFYLQRSPLETPKATIRTMKTASEWKTTGMTCLSAGTRLQRRKRGRKTSLKMERVRAPMGEIGWFGRR